MIAPVEQLAQALARLPGLGRRSASRAALALVRERERILDPLVDALDSARKLVTCCSKCGALTVRGDDPCRLCSDPARDPHTICVVEDPADIISIEASGAYRGRYHVLGGKISPMHRIGPDSLRIAGLQGRIGEEGVTEVLLALSTDMEGDATAGYLREILSPAGLKITRLAFGLPADSGVSYSDTLTLRRAINSRVAV